MKKRVIAGLFLVLLALFLLPTIAASSIDAEMQRLTHYAEQYETGNINYVQLLVYISAVRGNLNEFLGATEKEYGGILKQDQIKSILGEPNDETRWVWVEGLEHETKLDVYVPVWRKIIFDGQKIQIRLNAWPSIFMKKEFEGIEEKEKFKEEAQKFEEKEFSERDIIYRLNFEIEFKRPEEQLDIQGKINEIQHLAETFNAEPSRTNAEVLAKQSVNAERIFERYFKQNQGKCEDIMKSIFGSENQRESQKLLVQEIDFYGGDDFEVVVRLEMCDECEWNWINLDLWLEKRGPGIKIEEGELKMISPEQFKHMDSSDFKKEIIKLLDEYKQAAEQKQWKKLSEIKQRIWAINDAWNQKANEVWEEASGKKEGMTEEEQIEVKKSHQELEQEDPYYWIKREQETRRKVEELRERNYEERKQFYLNLFSGHYKKEYYFTQTEFEKRLVEEFRERGEEICNNNKDDNENGQVDCDDEQCGGKFCGKGMITIEEDNQTREVEVNLYCIEKKCAHKIEEIIKIKQPVCGNHKCEPEEDLTCPGDCILCPEHPPLECEGKVIFKGKDENGCPLEPICLEEKEFCETNEDCIQPLCGKAECIEGKCKVAELIECNVTECVDGDEKIKICESGEQIIADICIEGVWKKTDAVCKVEKSPEEGVTCEEYCWTLPAPTCMGAELKISGTYPDCFCKWTCEEPIDECITKNDCGGENDVCSNGECVTIPLKRHEEEKPLEEESKEEPEEEGEPETEQKEEELIEESEEEKLGEEPESKQEEAPTTGEVIFGFFRILLSKARITGAAITGFQTEEKPEPEEPSPGHEPEPKECPDPGEPPEVTDECWYEERYDEAGCVSGYDYHCEGQEEDLGDGEIKKEEDWGRKDKEERERHEEEQRQRCQEDCRRPCIDKCIRESCGEKMDCNIDEESKKCEGECEPESSCIEKCMSGEEDWWKEFEEEHKEEKGVFQAGGGCRTSQGRTEGFIWFGGWGDPFDQIQPLKTKYYSGGEADWCKHDLESLIKQRKEFEKGFNQEFATWFFEKYLANSAEDWEQATSGIFELYWKDVDMSRQIVERLQCLGKELDETEFNLINVKYDTEYGSLEFWEEIKTAELPGMQMKEGRKVRIISPYMKIWIFPPKSFITYEMKIAMKNHEFPGPPEEKMERKNQEGPTEEEKEIIRQDEKTMKIIREIAEKYGGSLDAAVQFKDYETDETVFNLFGQVNERDIVKVEPMLPSETPETDVKVEIDFALVYEMIYDIEKDMRGEMIESPPWDRRIKPMQKIKEIKEGIKSFFKVRKIINSAKYYPEESKKDIKKLFNTFIKMMIKGGMKEGLEPPSEEDIEEKGEEKGVWEAKEKITGEVIW